MTSSTVGNYKLLEKLGEGGMGAVYKGVDLMVEREVAIKMLRPEIARQPEIVERFRAEAVALAKLNHPNIATLYSFFRQGDEYFMVMEFVNGRTLDAIIRGAPPMPVAQTIAIASQVLEAIEHAHSFGILHRDIKPANIMLTASGQAKVTDFGIARVLGTSRMTREGCVCGTLGYLAPERIRGQEADIRSDLYSMGVVLYEMLSGRLPFDRDNEYELMRAHLEESPPAFVTLALTTVPAPLEMVVTKALAKVPEQRFGTAAEFRSALAAAERIRSPEPAWSAAETSNLAQPAPFVAEAPPAAEAEPPASVIPAAAPARSRWKIPVAVAAAVLLIGLVVMALSWSRHDRAAETTKPAPAPVVTQPSPPQVQPQAGDQPVSAPESLASQPKDETQGVSKDVAAPPGATATPTTQARKAKSNAKNASELERRKAALKALETPGTTKKSDKDRRSSSLEALKQ